MRKTFLLPFLLAVSILVFSSKIARAQNERSAMDSFAALQTAARQARTAMDPLGQLATARTIRTFLHDATGSVAFLAQAQWALNDTGATIHTLQQLANLGEGNAGQLFGTAGSFAGLDSTIGGDSVHRALKENERPVSRGTLVTIVPAADLLVEDIDYDAPTGDFLLTSVREHKIVRLTRRGKLSDFARSPGRWPMLAVKVDQQRKRVWATEVALHGFSSVKQSEWDQSALLCFDLHSGKLLKRIEGPAGAALGDMTLTHDGVPLLADGAKGRIYVLAGDSLQLIDSRHFISPQTPAMLPDGRHVLVPDYLRGIAILDLQTKAVRWLASKNVAGGALNGIDGVYYRNGRLFATMNGVYPERVMCFTLDRNLAHVVAAMPVERATTTLGDPTHGVCVGKSFYYISNSGWDRLQENGTWKAGTKPSSARIMCFSPHEAATRQPPGKKG